jgi:murein DD-endopeptidase MepM/ murein hydrolase activator NlpD
MARNRRSKISLLVTLLFIGFFACGAYLLFQDTDAPDILFSHTEESISPALPLTLTVTDATSAIKRITVMARFQENLIPIVNEEYADDTQSRHLSFSLKDAGLKNNDTFDLEITAVDNSFGGLGFGNKAQIILPLRLDSTPPRVSVKSPTPHTRRGGSACVVYSISKEVRQTGVKVNDLFFPSFRRENGDYLCFFAFPHTLQTKDFNPQLVALDKAGNLQVTNLPVSRINRQFKSDTINIGQFFLDGKAAEFETIVPGEMSDIERFLKVNGYVRKQNAATLMAIGQETASDMLWQGPFLRLPRSASRAGFADHRSYMWQGEKVDEQTHLGFDLASTKHAPVPAANNGNVVYAGYLGIYGNLIVIDHGLGLQSLYSHLSEIAVEKGQAIKKGDIIGKTGVSGMAGGDHLHFGILVSGLEVTPLEWLDAHWIKDNIIDRIKDAGLDAPTFKMPARAEEPQAKTPPKKKPAKKKKKR